MAALAAQGGSCPADLAYYIGPSLLVGRYRIRRVTQESNFEELIGPAEVLAVVVEAFRLNGKQHPALYSSR